jgi:hypothetical protein
VADEWDRILVARHCYAYKNGLPLEQTEISFYLFLSDNTNKKTNQVIIPLIGGLTMGVFKALHGHGLNSYTLTKFGTACVIAVSALVIAAAAASGANTSMLFSDNPVNDAPLTPTSFDKKAPADTESAASNNQANQGTEANVSIDTSIESSNTTDAEVTINGERITVPESGTVNETITSNGATTNVNVNVTNSSDGSDEKSSTRNSLRIRTSTSSTNYDVVRDNSDVIERGN